MPSVHCFALIDQPVRKLERKKKIGEAKRLCGRRTRSVCVSRGSTIALSISFAQLLVI